MKNHENMHEIRRQVGMYFDHALSKEDEQHLLQRVEHDASYHRVFSKEKAMREHIKNNVHRPDVSPDLIQHIKDKIRVS